MRLALKFSAGLTLGVALVLAAQAWLHVRRIAELQEREIRDDVVILARSLSAATSELWTTAGPARARAFIRRADTGRQRASIRLRQQAVRELEVSVVRRPQGWRVVAAAPVRGLASGSHVASLEIERALPAEREYFASIWQTQLATTGAAALLTGVIAFLLSALLIGRPLRQLSELAHRVAHGDFSLRASVVQHDEIGALARELNAMSEQLKQSDVQVRQERRARTAALEQLRHADRLSTVGRIASSVAHELGTPLNVIAGRATMISEDPGCSDEVGTHAAIVTEQAHRMSGIIRGLLDFSRKRPLQRKRTEVAEVLQRASDLMEPVAEGCHIVRSVPDTLRVEADIDAGKMLQVLTNLITNAIHAMPEGGTVTLGAARVYVDEPDDAHASRGEYVRIDVQDEGVGIPEAQLKDIFRAFFTTKREGRGTGLGLSVSHGIVREHDGFIRVKSVVGEGTCFSVFLPVREDT